MSYEVTYFPMYGRAESLKICLAHCGKEFTECNIEMADWGAKKASCVGGSVPNLKCPDGTVLGHSTNGILRMLCTENGLYPTDPI